MLHLGGRQMVGLVVLIVSMHFLVLLGRDVCLEFVASSGPALIWFELLFQVQILLQYIRNINIQSKVQLMHDFLRSTLYVGFIGPVEIVLWFLGWLLCCMLVVVVIYLYRFFMCCSCLLILYAFLCASSILSGLIGCPFSWPNLFSCVNSQWIECLVFEV